MAVLIKNLSLNSISGEKNTDVYISKEGIGKKGEADYILDGKGCILLRSFTNGHTHTGMGIMKGIVEDLPFFPWLEKLWAIEAKIGSKEVRAGSIISMWEMIKSGVTTFFDMYPFLDQTAELCEEYGLKGYLFWPVIDQDKTTQKGVPIKNAEKFVKQWSKSEDVIPGFGPHAVYSCSQELLEKTVELSKKYNAPMHMHAAETRKEVWDCYKERGKRVVEYLESVGILGEKSYLAHCCWVTKGEIRKLALTKTKVVHCPVSNMKLGTGGFFPMKEMKEYGVEVLLGTDSSTSNNTQDMWETMKFASLLAKHNYWNPAVIKAEQILQMAQKYSDGFVLVRLKLPYKRWQNIIYDRPVVVATIRNGRVLEIPERDIEWAIKVREKFLAQLNI